MSKIAIVIVTYMREKSLVRLLNSLLNVDYLGDTVDLIISIDFSGKESIKNVATNFNWKFGKKEIVAQTQKLGLRDHILKCGDFTNQYSHICLIEDDLLVSPGIYNFAKQAAEYYENDDSIAGISLYTHLYNHIANRPFYPIDDGFDVFFLQQAQSWGQLWSTKKWAEFRAWYDKNTDMDFKSDDFPEKISRWPSSSWLKYHNKYIVETNKYFVYPRVSLITNFSEPGTNRNVITSTFQVPLQLAKRKIYNFSDLSNSKSIYDVFFESELLADYLLIPRKELQVDLFSSKVVCKKKYLLSVNKFDYDIIKSYAMELRPLEANVIYNIKGNDIFLYDTNKKKINNSNTYVLEKDLKRFLYDTRIPVSIIHIIAAKLFIKEVLKNKMSKIFNFFK